MSRLYGRSFDVYQMSNYILSAKIPKYNDDNKKITLEELIDSTGDVEIYLPQTAIDYIINYPIHIVKSPIIPRNMSEFSNFKNSNATIYFKGINFKEEQKRDLVFFLGCVLSQVNPDELPKNNDLPCEYGDILPLLLEYLYLKENNKEDIFLPKHLESLKFNAKKYTKSYEIYHKYLANNGLYESSFLSQKQQEKIEEYNTKLENDFLKNTLTMLVPFSSVDGVLQVIDKTQTKEEYKELIAKLYENKKNNRQDILKDYNIESYGYKRLRKEIDRRVK